MADSDFKRCLVLTSLAGVMALSSSSVGLVLADHDQKVSADLSACIPSPCMTDCKALAGPIAFKNLEVQFRDIGTDVEIIVTDVWNHSETILTLPVSAPQSVEGQNNKEL